MADAPVEALLARVDALAKGWLLELVDQAPLDHAASILAGELARTGPALCHAVIRALSADSALSAIEAGGSREPLAWQIGRLAAASEVEDVSLAVDALMAVLWSATLSELRDPEAELVSELAERLAHVIEVVRRAALARFAGQPTGDVGDAANISARARSVDAGATAAEPAGAAAESPAAADSPAAASATLAPERGEPAADEVRIRRLDEQSSADSRVRTQERPERPRAPSVRSEALWVGAIDDEIERAERTGSPLSLLLVELEDADRVVAVEDPLEASLTFRRFAQAVRTVVRRQDILACESDSRTWIIAPGSDRRAAHALGSRIESAVRAAQPWRGAPMTVSVGLSVLDEDGHESATLMDAAEEARFAATAEGVAVHATGRPDADPSARGGPKKLD